MPLPSLATWLNGQGQLTQWPSKRKYKNEALQWLGAKFEDGKDYTEKEVNEILSQFHTFNDPALLRRELFEAKYLDRTRDGRKYWKLNIG